MSSNRVVESFIANGWTETSTPGKYKSKTISHSQTTSVVVENIRQISFNYSVSSESRYDWFNFYINGTQRIQQSGTVNSSFEYSSDTSFNIKFEYTKDGSTDSGNDCVYISNIQYKDSIVDLELDSGVVITYFEEKRISNEEYEYIIDINNDLWFKGDSKILGTYEEFTKIEGISNIQELVSLTDIECIYIDTNNDLWIKGEKYNKIYEEFTLINGYYIDDLIHLIYYTPYFNLLSEDERYIMSTLFNRNVSTSMTEEEKNEFIIYLYNKYEINEDMFAEKENEYKEYLINLYRKYCYTNTFYDSENNKGKEYKIRIKNLEPNSSVYLFNSYIENYKYRQIDNIYSDFIDEYSFKHELIENENNVHKFLYKTLPGDYSLSIDNNLNGKIKIYLDNEEYNLFNYDGSIIIFIDNKSVEHNIEILYDDNDLNNFNCYINKFIKRSIKLNSDKYYLKIEGNENFNISENNIKYINFIYDITKSDTKNYYIYKYLNEAIKNSYQIELLKKKKDNINYPISYDINFFNNVSNNLFTYYKNENENKMIFKFNKLISTTPFYNDNYGIKIVSIKKQCTKMSFYHKISGNSIYNIVYLYIDGIYKGGYGYTSSWKQIIINDLTDEEHEFTWVLCSYNNSSSYSCIDTIAFNDIVETDSNKFNNKGNIPLADIPINSNYINGTNTSTPFYNNNIGVKIVSIKKQCTKMSFYYKTNSNRIYLYIDGIYKDEYTNTSWTQIIINDLTDEEHEFTWVLCSYNNNSSSYSCIDTIAFNDIVEIDSNKFSNNSNIPIVEPNDNKYKLGFDLVTVANSNINFSVIYYDLVNMIIDVEYINREKKYFENIKKLNNIKENLDVLIFDNLESYFLKKDIETTTDSKYKNGTNTSTPFYTDKNGIKIVSIKKQCTKMSFYYKVYDNSVCNRIFLYIDGIYKDEYINTSWIQIIINDLTDEEHEFTWVLYSSDINHYSCIDTIAFNDIVETDSNKFSNTYEKELKYINSTYINGTKSSTPFYNNYGIKIVSIKKQCTKMSFYYKVGYSSSNNIVYLYIDGIYKNTYTNYSSWTQIIINDLTDKEHEFTWVLYSSNTSYYSYIDTIAFDDITETDSSKFSNTCEKELKYIDSNYMNGTKSSTPFYNNRLGIKIVSIKKQCTKMSFYYKMNNSNYNIIYLYIDGIYKGGYINTSWTQAIFDNLTDEEHEFTWVLCSYNNSSSYSCIDTIAFNDIVETDSNKFSNNGNIPLADIPTDSNYINSTNTSTPFYNNNYGIKIVSIKKQCTKMSFYHKVSSNSIVYIYIDGIYKGGFGYFSWTQAIIDDLTDEEHEFTWVLCSYNNNSSSYSCIDTIAFNDIVETDIGKFINNTSIPLAYAPDISSYKNGTNTSTPFYNNNYGIRIVSIKKQCTKMSFYHKIIDSIYNRIFLYIDGIYKGGYVYTSWTQITINNLTDEEHEFTWVLYNSKVGYYSCIDTIAFNDIVETDSNKFSNTYEKELKYINSTYINGTNTSTPFYNNIGVKIVSIKKQCTKMSFYYKVGYSSSNNIVYLYIDGIYKDEYINTSWTQAIIDNLTDEEHEFTWVLYSSNAGYYSCVDTIAFNDIVETDSNKFSNTCENKIKYSYIYIEPEKDINFSNQQVKLNEEKYNEFVLSDRKNKIFKINPNNYSELESILQSPDIIDIIVSNENGDHVVLTTKAKQRIFTRDIDTNEPNMPFIIKSNPDAIGSLKVSNVKTEFNKSDLKVTNEIDIGELTNEIEDPVFEDIENGYCMKIEDVNE